MHLAARLRELVGDDGRQRVSRREQRGADRRRVPDDHRDGHRLSERAPQPEHGGADDSGSRIRKHRGPDRFPPRCAQRQRSLAQLAGDGPQHLDADRGDGGQDHDREDHAGGEISEPDGRALEQGKEPERVREKRLHRLPQEGHEHEQPPEPVDDAGNAREQRDGKRYDRADGGRRHFGEEQRQSDGDGKREDQRDRARHQRPVDVRRGAEQIAGRVPGRLRHERLQPRMSDGRGSDAGELGDDDRGGSEHAEPEHREQDCPCAIRSVTPGRNISGAALRLARRRDHFTCWKRGRAFH